jgi:hypothetical protein
MKLMARYMVHTATGSDDVESSAALQGYPPVSIWV